MNIKRLTVEEELDKDVDTQHTMATNVFVGETPDDEKDSQESEANELEGLATDGVDCSYR